MEDYGYAWRLNYVLSQYAEFEVEGYSYADVAFRTVASEKESDRYNQYQHGADLFRAEEYLEALKIFNALRDSADSKRNWLNKLLGRRPYSWVTEASSYMIARCKLLLSQSEWYGYEGGLKLIDQALLKSADSSYLVYLKEYPEGLYAKSAINLKRKILYLSGQRDLLDQALKKEILSLFPSQAGFTVGATIDPCPIAEFSQYFRGKVDFAQDSPVLTAYAWLRDSLIDPEDLILLEQRESDFAPYPGLFRFAKALGLYRLGRYQALVEKISYNPVTNEPLWLSTQWLRVRSFEKLSDTAAAMAALKEMHAVSAEDAVELEMAKLKLSSRDGLWFFADSTPRMKQENLVAIATVGLSDSELVQALALTGVKTVGRQVLAAELARRLSLSERFTNLSELLDKVPVSLFLPVKSTISVLAKDPNDIPALVDMGEFLYGNFITPGYGFSGYSEEWWVEPPIRALEPLCEPCKDFHRRASGYTPPLWFFLRAVELSQAGGKQTEAEAKALHYIVRAGRRNYSWSDRCTWGVTRFNENPMANSRNAFIRLHRLYKDSPWTAKTPYWYK
jgi:hypothetical protein